MRSDNPRKLDLRIELYRFAEASSQQAATTLLRFRMSSSLVTNPSKLAFQPRLGSMNFHRIAAKSANTPAKLRAGTQP